MLEQKIRLEIVDYSQFMHNRQMYGNKDYFNGHIRVVVNNLLRIIDELEFTVGERILMEAGAFLHDVVEDTSGSLDQIQSLFGCTELTNLVDSLTQRRNEARWNYLSRLSKNKFAIYVKLADSTTNLHKGISTGDPKRASQYLDSMKFLLNHLEMLKGED